MPKKRKGSSSKLKYQAYKSSSRKLHNKISKLVRRWCNYKIQPAKAVNGILDVTLRERIKKALDDIKKKRRDTSIGS